MRPVLPTLALLLLVGCADQQDARGCVSARDLASSVLRIDRAQGSAFITKSTEMVTVKHVADAVEVSSTTWKYVTVSQKTQLPFDVWNTSTVLMRIKRVFARNLPEELHLLEMQKQLTWPVSVTSLRKQPLNEGEPVTGIGYTHGRMRSATGDFVSSKFTLQNSSVTTPMVQKPFSGFKLTNTNQQYPLAYGSSGGGIFDCGGSLVGAIARAHNEKTPSHGRANVFAVPTHSVAKEILH